MNVFVTTNSCRGKHCKTDGLFMTHLTLKSGEILFVVPPTPWAIRTMCIMCCFNGTAYCTKKESEQDIFDDESIAVSEKLYI